MLAEMRQPNQTKPPGDKAAVQLQDRNSNSNSKHRDKAASQSSRQEKQFNLKIG
jgi:hypothetical protein